MRRLSELKLTASTLGLSFLAAVACTEAPAILDVSLDQPGALVVAGTGTPRLFIANTGQESLQVLELVDGLEQVSFVGSQAIYFPLRIPSGPAPEEMAATEDGRFVVLLDWLTETMKVLDADSLEYAQAGGVDLDVIVGPQGSHPYGLVPVPGCAELCSGRFAVSLSGAGAVSVVVVNESEAGDVSVEVENVFEVGGTPGPLAASADGRLIFVGDTLSDEVVRLDLMSGAVDRVNVGAVPGALAVSTLGRHLLVSRPAYHDVVVFDGASGVLELLDANARLAPIPKCVPDCESDLSPLEQCPGAHPADLSLCSNAAGIEQKSGAGYTGLYLGFIPSSVKALGAGLGQPALNTPCCTDSLTNDDTATCDSYVARSWDEYFAVAGLHGNVTFVGVSNDSGSARPELLNEGWCNQAGLAVDESDTEVSEEVSLDPGLLLKDCSDLPFDLNRFECVVPEDGGFGVGFLPGRRARTLVQMRWEGVIGTGLVGLPFMERPSGGGSLTRDGERVFLSDTGIDLSNYDDVIVSREDALFAGECSGEDPWCGDIIEFIDPLLETPECIAALGDEPAQGCSLERRILTVSDEEGGRLKLDRDLPDACLPEAGRIAYRIRAADTYTVLINSVQYRAKPGAKVGLGGEVGERESVVLALRDTELEFASAGACERHGVGGLLESQPAFSRDLAAGIRVYDALLDLRNEGTTSAAAYSLTVDVLYDADGRLKGVGQYGPQLHQGMAIYEHDDLPVIFNAYAASNAVIAFVPAAIPSSSAASVDDESASEGADGEAEAYLPTGGEFRSNAWYSDPRMYRVIN